MALGIKRSKGASDVVVAAAVQKRIDALKLAYPDVDLKLIDTSVDFTKGNYEAAISTLFEGAVLAVIIVLLFLRDVVNKVGIDKLITMHNTDQEAVKAVIKHLNQRELAGDAPVDHEKVMITFQDEIRNKMIGGKKTLLGTISNVDGHKLVFLFNGSKTGISADQGKQLFFNGSEVHLRFQVKMIKKSYFELVAIVETAEPAGDGGVRVTAKFKKASEGDREALAQFAADMAFLKRQLPGS